MSGVSSNIGAGQQNPNDSSNEFNRTMFAARQKINRLNVMKLVKVISVTGGGGALAAAGTVNVQPLVSQIDGQGNVQDHGIVNNIPWWRLQGGNSAIICDPQVGDIGFVVCSDRDTSTVRSTRKVGPPGSFRKYRIEDGIYVGGCLNDQPTQFIGFTSAGINVVDLNGNEITLSTSGIAIFSASNMQIGDVHGNLIAMSSSGLNLISSAGVEVSGALHVTGAAIFDASIQAVTGIFSSSLQAVSLVLSGAIMAVTGVFSSFITAVGNITAGFGGVDSVTVQGHTHVYDKSTGTTTFADTTSPNPGS